MSEEGEAQGAWIFVSHSHKDLAKVRRVRNALEERGHNPLLFFLKCLGDDSEVDDLIRREIEARTWFVLCDSPSARVSRWVQAETEIIKSLEGKVFTVVDLDDDLDEQLRKLAGISQRATVFISYAQVDSEIAESIASALRAQDFAVSTADEAWEDYFNPARRTGSDASPDSDWRAALDERIREATEKGFFLTLLSPEALGSEWVQSELDVAARVASTRRVVPVLVRDYETTLGLLSTSPFGDRLFDFWDLTKVDLDLHVSLLLRDLKTRAAGEDLERLAEAAHIVYCAERLEEGMSWFEPSDEYLVRHPPLQRFAGRPRDPARTLDTLVAYQRVSEEVKEQNRTLVWDIGRKLAMVGYAMQPAESGDPPPELSSEEIELVAEQAHERWLRAKLAAGWSYGDLRDDPARRHPVIVTWSKTTFEERVRRYGQEWAQRIGDPEMPEHMKDMDRAEIKGILRVLAVAGYTMVKPGTPTDGAGED